MQKYTGQQQTENIDTRNEIDWDQPPFGPGHFRQVYSFTLQENSHGQLDNGGRVSGNPGGGEREAGGGRVPQEQKPLNRTQSKPNTI